MYEADWFGQWEKLTSARKPIIGAVAGFALGDGCELAMMCDEALYSVTGRPTAQTRAHTRNTSRMFLWDGREARSAKSAKERRPFDDALSFKIRTGLTVRIASSQNQFAAYTLGGGRSQSWAQSFQ
jgi:Autoinducer binding domain/Enoyl-CoA hydratase/isomerase